MAMIDIDCDRETWKEMKILAIRRNTTLDVMLGEMCRREVYLANGKSVAIEEKGKVNEIR